MKEKLFLVIHLIIMTTVTFSQVSTVDLVKEYTFTNGSLSNTINSGTYDLTPITSPETYTKTVDALSQADAALSLNGNELSAGQHPTTAIIDADFSVSFWIKTTNNTTASVFRQRGANGTLFAGIRAYLQNGALSFGGHYRLGTSNYYSETTLTSKTINDGDWHHVVINGYLNKRASGSLTLIKYDYKIYIDNVLDASGSTTDGFDYGADAYLFHGNPDLIIGSPNFQGDLDNFRVYTRSLDVSDIDALYNELQQTHTLITSARNGSVIVDIQPTNGTYADGTVVELIAVAKKGYRFDGWSGDVTGTTNPLSITMDADKNITAMFSVDTTASTVDDVFNNSISTYPNPIGNTLTIGLAIDQAIERVEVFSLLGGRVIVTKNATIDFSTIAAGIYILKVENIEGETATRKIIKK